MSERLFHGQFLGGIIVLVSLLLCLQAEAASRCSPSSNYGPYVEGVCNHRPLPQDETWRWGNLRLECGSNSSHYIRRPFPISDDLYNKWADYDDDATSGHTIPARKDMQKLMREAQQDITWSGAIPYETVEKWDYTTCAYGEDEDACGSRTHRVKHSDGTVTEEKEILSCYHTESRSASRDCSTETMKYDASFIRPALTEWGPGIAGVDYLDLLPNKYDLMPGELEDIQIYNSKNSLFGDATHLGPKVEVGDKWNEYTPLIQFTNGHTAGSDTATCIYGFEYHIDVKLRTEHRIKKAPPNALGKPLNDDGSEVGGPFQWVTRGVASKDGEVRVKPSDLLLTDTSSRAINDLARQTRKYEGDLEKARADAGENTNADPVKVREAADRTTKTSKGKVKGFMKDTHMKIQLYEFPVGERHIRKTHDLETTGAAAVPFKTKDRKDEYRVPLMGESSDDDLYRSSAPLGLEFVSSKFSVNLRPGRKYAIMVSMSQKGVPFYLDNAWSKPLQLDFKLDKDKDLDDRTFLEKKRNWLGDAFWKKPYTFFTDFF